MSRTSEISLSEDDLDILDVVIIGSGLSGMTAAFRLFLLKTNLTVRILEAKDRIGGRIFTTELNASNKSTDFWDLGGSWIGKRSLQPFINQLLMDLNIKTYPQNFVGNKMALTGTRHKISTYDASIPESGLFTLLDASRTMKSIESLQKKLSATDCLTDPNLLEYDSMTAETLFKKKIHTQTILDCVRSGLRVAFGSELNKLSALYLLAFANSCGGFYNILGSGEASAHGYKIVGGAAKINQAILDVIGDHVLELNTVVMSITKKDRYSVIQACNGKIYRAKNIIVAIPPNLIRNIIFDPPLNPTKNEYFSSVIPGHLIKFIITYETRFWLSEGLSGEILSTGGKSYTDDCSAGPVCVVFDGTTENKSPALVGFIGGERALQYEAKNQEERKEAILKSLESFFKKDSVRDFIDYGEKIWRFESFVGGCPVTIVPPGVARNLNQLLREPENNIYFAGSELSKSWSGFMEGAVESGEVAALQVLSTY